MKCNSSNSGYKKILRRCKVKFFSWSFIDLFDQTRTRAIILNQIIARVYLGSILMKAQLRTYKAEKRHS